MLFELVHALLWVNQGGNNVLNQLLFFILGLFFVDLLLWFFYFLNATQSKVVFNTEQVDFIVFEIFHRINCLCLAIIFLLTPFVLYWLSAALEIQHFCVNWHLYLLGRHEILFLQNLLQIIGFCDNFAGNSFFFYSGCKGN